MVAPRIIVVGGGLAGLSFVIRACEKGASILLFSIVPVKRSHSVCAQGGINAAVNLKGEGDSPYQHFYDTIYGGDFLAEQLPVKNMCEEAPNIIYLLARMGVPFNRTPEGFLDFRRFGGTLYSRTAFAGATTGQQMLYALDEQVRSFEAKGQVKKYEGWEFLSLVKNSQGHVCGITAINMNSMEIVSFKADAVVIATGGPGYIFGKSTNSITNTGAAVSRCFQQGAYLGNPEFIQVHPTAIPGIDKLRLISEAARGEGGRVWTYKDGKRWYFFEEMFPKYGNLVPRDVASRTIYKVVNEMGLGVEGKQAVYLDVTHLPPQVHKKLEGILEIYEKFMGKDPRKEPMLVYPAVHYSMGGLWVDYDHMTNIPGLYAVGECDYQYHGANRLGANSLLSCIYSGLLCGSKCVDYLKNSKTDYPPDSVYEDEVKKQNEFLKKIMNSRGNENVFSLYKEMATYMGENCLIVYYEDKLKKTLNKLNELQERFNNIELIDKGNWANQSLLFARQLYDMLIYAKVVTLAALERKESRGSLYKPEYPKRDDENWLKTTKAKYVDGKIELEYEKVETPYIKPTERKYT